MFTAQDILEIAIRLENNGEKAYRDALRRNPEECLKALLAWIAEEEHNHANWFKGLKARLADEQDHHLLAELSQALVEDVVKGQAFSLQEVDFAEIDTPAKMIHTFIGFEEDTIAFYQVLKSLIDDSAIVAQLDQIISEENTHIAKFQEMLSTC